MIPLNQLPLVDETLKLLNAALSQLMTIQGDCVGDLNRYKEEYQANIRRLLQRNDSLWRKINALAQDAPAIPAADESSVWEEDPIGEDEYDDEDEETDEPAQQAIPEYVPPPAPDISPVTLDPRFVQYFRVRPPDPDAGQPDTTGNNPNDTQH